GDVRPEWKLVPELAALITKAQSKLGADTRIALSELSIAFIPVTEIIFDLGEQKPAAPPAQGGKPAKPRHADSGLYSWYIYGFERQLPRDWRFLAWERVLMYIFGALLVLLVLAIVLISLLQL
ncbi:MAG: serine/threonine protein kinase, partial [Kouleothrix sp.]